MGTGTSTKVEMELSMLSTSCCNPMVPPQKT